MVPNIVVALILGIVKAVELKEVAIFAFHLLTWGMLAVIWLVILPFIIDAVEPEDIGRFVPMVYILWGMSLLVSGAWNLLKKGRLI